MKRNAFKILFRAIPFALIVTFCLAVPGPAASASAAAQSNALTVAMPSLFEETFLPWNGAAMRKYYLDPIYEYLVYLDPETKQAKPGLAEKWQMSKDGKTWTFWLRKGVQFHDGYGELTAEDVKYSLERFIDPKSITGPSSVLRRLVNKVEAPDKYRVIITLNVPDAEFDRGNMSNGFSFGIVSKKYLEAKGDGEANLHPIGTGPFAFAEHRRGLSVTLKARTDIEKHWRVKSDFQNITFLAVPEESTRVAMLKAGEVSMCPINADSIESVKAAGLNALSIKNSWVSVIRLGGLIKTNPKFYNPNVPWADKRVRQALNHAIDKAAIVKNIFHGQASPAGADMPVPQWLGIPAYPYDLQKAKGLLASAGYPDGFDITLKTLALTPGAELPIIGQAVAMYWQALGLKVKIEPTEWPSLGGAWSTGKATDFAWTHRGVAFSSPASGLQTNNLSKSVYASYATEETEARVAAIEKELDPKKRGPLLRKMGEFLHDEAACVYVVFADEPYGASKDLAKWPTLSEFATNFDLVTRTRK
jgi:peptide/nickel transport system substrate-binding protein